MTDRRPVEVMILADVKARARARAEQQGDELAAIARQIVTQVAAVAMPVEGGRPTPDTSVRGVTRKRLRLTVPDEQWTAERDRIRASGKSVTRVIEDGLQHYAETGRIDLPPWLSDEPHSFELPTEGWPYRANYSPERGYTVVAPDGRDLGDHETRSDALRVIRLDQGKATTTESES